MKWFVSNAGNSFGPIDADEVQRGIREGKIVRGMYVRDELAGSWALIESSPFAKLLAPDPAMAAQDSPGVRASKSDPKATAGGCLIILVALAGLGYIINTCSSDDKEATLTTDPAAPPVVTENRNFAPRNHAEQPEIENQTSLGSAATFEAWFQKLEFEFGPSPLADGTPRRLGTSPDKLCTIEIIGRGDLFGSASIMFGLDKNNPAEIVRTTGAIMVFTRELGWPSGHEWVMEHMSKGDAETTKNGVSYRLQVLKELGIFTLTAKPQ